MFNSHAVQAHSKRFLLTTAALLVCGTVLADGQAIDAPDEGAIFYANESSVTVLAHDHVITGNIIQWAIREGTCDAGNDYANVAGNVGGWNSDFDWSDGNFAFTLDTTQLNKGDYCFIFNTTRNANGVRLTRWFALSEVAEVVIDIKPGSDPNCFNVNGHGVIPVAVLGSDWLDVTTIDPESLAFGELVVRVRGKKGPLCSFEDTNLDGYEDLVCHFEDDSEAWTPGDGYAALTGLLFDGTPITGVDEICIVP